MASVNKKLVEKLGDVSHFSVVCFEKIYGTVVSDEQWNENHFNKLGTLVGQLHTTGNQFPEKDNQKYKHWNEIPEHDCFEHLKTDYYDYRNLYRSLIEGFNALELGAAEYGIIHYDIHHGNYLLQEHSSQLLLFDFEMTCKSWFINDIAAVLYYATLHVGNKSSLDVAPHLLNAFWQAYEKHKVLSQEAKSQLPKFILYRNLLVMSFVNELWDQDNLTPQQTAFLDQAEASVKQRLLRL